VLLYRIISPIPVLGFIATALLFLALFGVLAHRVQQALARQ
jgi:hypothetical protein